MALPAEDDDFKAIDSANLDKSVRLFPLTLSVVGHLRKSPSKMVLQFFAAVPTFHCV